MKLHAYVLLADGAWLESSIRSYYDAVDCIVASYDENHVSWLGDPVPTQECIDRLKAIDTDGKVEWLGRDFTTPGQNPMVGETAQRRASLEVAAEGADAVVQLDTDEVVLDRAMFVDSLERGFGLGAAGVEYPARYLVAPIRQNWYLERADRYGRTWPAIPGPIAVLPTATITYARQIAESTVRCGWRQSTRIPVSKSGAIAHLATVRTASAMEWKSRTSSHAQDFDWEPTLRAWDEQMERPLVTTVRSYRPGAQRLRPARVAMHLDEAEIRTGVEDWS